MSGHELTKANLVHSDHALLGETLDLLGGHPEQLAIDVLVVLAITRRPAVDASADVRRALAHLDGHLGDRPATDLRAGHLGQPRERRQLRITVAPVRRRLAHAGRHAGALQGQHRLVQVARFRPPTDERVEDILVLEPPREILEAAVIRPLRMSRDFGQRAPFGVREAGDGEPAIVPGAGIDVVGYRRLVGRAVAVA